MPIVFSDQIVKCKNDLKAIFKSKPSQFDLKIHLLARMRAGETFPCGHVTKYEACTNDVARAGCLATYYLTYWDRPMVVEAVRKERSRVKRNAIKREMYAAAKSTGAKVADVKRGESESESRPETVSEQFMVRSPWPSIVEVKRPVHSLFVCNTANPDDLLELSNRFQKGWKQVGSQQVGHVIFYTLEGVES